MPVIAVAVLALALPAAKGAPAWLDARLAKSSLRQGTTVDVTIHSAAVLERLSVRFTNRSWPVYHAGERAWRTILATDPTTTPGRRTVIVDGIAADGRRLTLERDVIVSRVAFQSRRIAFDRTRQALLSQEASERERRRVAEALRVPAQDQLWRGPLALPVDARVSSPYGVLSIYQGVVRGFHTGVDFAADEGAPVRAAADGIVRLAEALPVSGNAVLVDHGVGVVSSYLHLSAITVQAGQRVTRGQIIGQVGATGLATGPHLHWGLRVNGVRVDPLSWAQP
jgi:murein DD-endopeptidase MepM/ murein hydrolase activator NlpD